MSRGQRSAIGLLAIVSCVFALLLYAEALWMGDLNQDEGWYLHASRLVHAGQVPYRDFFYSQTPLLPYVYGALFPVWSPHGVAGGRALTAVFGLLAAFLAAWLTARLVPRHLSFAAGLTCFALLAVNPYYAYFTTIVKTYGLAALLVTGGFLALSYSSRRVALGSALLAGFLLACAAGTRISLGAMLPVAGLYLLWHRRQAGHPWRWVAFGVGGLVGLAAIFGPSLIFAKEGFAFSVSYHVDRESRGLMDGFVNRAGFMSRFLRAYTVAAIVAFASLCWTFINRRQSRAAPVPGVDTCFAGLLLTAFLAVSLVHVASPFPYDDYQTPIAPLLAIFGSVLLWRNLSPQSTPESGERGAHETAHPVGSQACVVLATVFVAVLVTAGTSELHQDWVILKRDRFWWIKKPAPPLQVLRETARRINELYPQKGVMLTQDAYLAVEAGWELPVEFAMGPFSYFPGLSTDEARRVKVVNDELLSELLGTSTAPVAAFSGYGLAIAAPHMRPLSDSERGHFLALVEDRFSKVMTVPHFGQAHTPLTVYALKELTSGEGARE
ncbi:MAG: hypothetical protein O2923_13655 [Verrucomicrobia bacterium]|nr:hypothetical protein [Verrucomicrobiota bacterium]MDA1087142.1 hypothetical protein [Verrucomicrobiota bacterium]